jgi:NADH dehydrogenase
MHSVLRNEMGIPNTKNPRLIIIGGGFAGIKLALSLKNENLQIVLFDRNNYHTFQPLLYQVATAGLEPDSIAGPLRQQLELDQDLYFRMGKVHKINPEKQILKTEIGEIMYDYLIIATGSKTNYYGIESVLNNAFPLKQISHALDLRHHILQNFEKAVNQTNKGKINQYMNILIAGGGPTGVELAGALGELKKSVLPKDYPELNINHMNIFLVEGQDRLLGAMRQKSSEKALKYLTKFDVTVKLNTFLNSFDGENAELSNGEIIKTQTVIWASGVKGNIIDGLPEQVIEKDRIVVDQFNRVKGFSNLFAIGDVALMNTEKYPSGHPMVAPVAIQQARHLSKNLKRMYQRKALKAFTYREKGTMATIGRNKAVVDLPGNISFGGLLAWIIWMFVHLVSIYGLRNKMIVFGNWVYNYFTYDRGTRLIIRRFKPKFKAISK